MKRKIVKKNNKWKYKWELEFSDWLSLVIVMATIDYIVWQILRG